jgi:hypothetical protein
MAENQKEIPIRKAVVRFGKEVAQDFLFEPGWLNLNHGEMPGK